MIDSRLARYSVLSSIPLLGAIAVAACSSSSSPNGGGAMSGATGGATTGGSSSTGGVESGSTGPGGTGPSGGSVSGDTTSSSSGSSTGATAEGAGANDGGSPGDATTSGEGGCGQAAEAGPKLVNCGPADLGPCGSYSTPAEDGGTDTIQLGPYGATGDPNIGKGFENTVQSSDQSGSMTCALFAATFNESQSLTQQLLKTMMNGITIDFSLYSAYYPATWPSTPVPVITWGDGTCAQPEGYGALLRYVASYGYFVIAANSREVGSNNTDGTQPMLHALDFAAAANKDPSSPFYQKLDLTKIGAMGHSQGGGATAAAASDARVKYVIIFNANDSGVAKPYLALSGDSDITGYTAQSMSSAIDGSNQPAAYLYYHNPIGAPNDGLKGHLVLMLTPERVAPQTVAWWEMWFRNDATSKADFVGSSCGFCGHGSDAMNAYEYGHNTMLQ